VGGKLYSEAVVILKEIQSCEVKKEKIREVYLSGLGGIFSERKGEEEKMSSIFGGAEEKRLRGQAEMILKGVIQGERHSLPLLFHKRGNKTSL